MLINALYEVEVRPDQLWKIEESEQVCRGYHIKNLIRPTMRLTQFKASPGWDVAADVGMYEGHYYPDQVWYFKKEGEYYRIYNHKHKKDKLTKWAKADDAFGAYYGPDAADQLWKLVPRYKLLDS